MSKYGVSSGPYFPVFGLNAGKYEPEITPHWDTFYAMRMRNHTDYFLSLVTSVRQCPRPEFLSENNRFGIESYYIRKVKGNN